MNITDEMVERLAVFLQSEWAGPYMARIREYASEGLWGEARVNAIAEFQTADREAYWEARRMARRALETALGKEG